MAINYKKCYLKFDTIWNEYVKYFSVLSSRDFFSFEVLLSLQCIARQYRMRKGHDCEHDGRNRTEQPVSDTCLRMVRRPKAAARRYVAPYRACNMHVSIRTLSNISFRSIYPNALSCGRCSRCELYSISRFPPVCRRRARHKQARRCKKAYVSNYYDPEETAAGGHARFRAHSARPLVAPAPGAFNRYVDARSCASCSIAWRGA